MSKPKKLLVLLLIVIFSFSQFPVTVLAESEDTLLPGGGLFAEPNQGQQSDGDSLIEQVNIITAFTQLPEELRHQQTLPPQLPESVEAVVDGKIVQVPITWQGDPGYDVGNPPPGIYVFTAVVGDGYQVAEGLTLPVITVYVSAAGDSREGNGEVTNGDAQQASPLEEQAVPVDGAGQDGTGHLQSQEEPPVFQGSGDSEDDPYLITSAEDLKMLNWLIKANLPTRILTSIIS